MGVKMPAPASDPEERDPAAIRPTGSYQRADRVWVYRGGTWCAGVVESASERAVTVTYRPGASRGTAADTLVAASCLHLRDDVDSVLDRGLSMEDANGRCTCTGTCVCKLGRAT
jgi:hypothetical protein